MPPQSPLAWVRGYYHRAPGPVSNTYTALYSLNELINKGFIDANEGRTALGDSGLTDMVWELTWAEDYETPDELLEPMMTNCQGYVVFVHGWTGNHLIWEDVPGMLVTENRQLVAISLDHNGFGQSGFVDETPSLEMCNPPAAMRALERLVKVLRIRRQPGQTQRKVINFVGHSMGGATLFYLNPVFWDHGEETRYAIAPALLLGDSIHKAFFTTLGIGIGIVDRFRAFSLVERAIKPTMIEQVCSGGSEFLKHTHRLQYDETPRGITASTFTAMGMLADYEIARKWDLFRVMLGHKDVLVGLVPMMDLLSQLEFPAGHVRVVAGSHYMFSVGRDSALQHSQNRELVVRDVLHLHAKALEQQKMGKRVG